MKRNKLSVDNGISLQCHPVERERIKLPWLSSIFLVLLSVMTTVSAVMTFSTILQLKIQPTVVISATVGFCALFGLVYSLFKRFRYIWLTIIAAVVIAALVFLIFKESLMKGANILYYQGLKTIYDFMYWDITFKPTYTFTNELLPLTNSVIVLLSFLISSAVSYFIIVKPSFIAIVLLTFPFFEIGAAFGAIPEYFYMYLMVASWTSTLAYSIASNSKIKVKKGNGKATVSKMKQIGGKFSTSAISIALITVILLSSITSFLNSINFQRVEDVDALRKNMKYISGDIVDYITGKDNDASLKEGNLLEMGDRIVKDRHYFYLATSMQKTKEHLKVKGYTATVYKNNKWQQCDNYATYNTLYDKLDEYALGFGGMNGALLSSHKDYEKFNSTRITIGGLRRKKDYAYELYFADFDDEYESNMDIFMKPNERSKYSYNAYLDYEYLFKVVESNLYKTAEYQEIKREYTDFVNKEYTVSAATKSVKQLAGKLNTGSKYQLVDKIRQYFKDNYAHKYTIQKCPEDEDFVENFLFKTKRGYCAHFATAAAVMIQSQGIPARYVEGYFIPKDDFNETESNHEYGYITFDVTDKYAHAWIEVYDENFGWIPIEVTPGYWSDSIEEMIKKYKKQNVEIVKPNQEETEEPLPEEEEKEKDKEKEENTEETTQESDEPFEYTVTINIGIVLVIVAVVILLIVLFILFWIGYIVFTGCIRNMKLNSKNDRQVLKTAYGYYNKLAKADGIKISNIYNYGLYVRKAASISDRVDANALKQFLDIMLKNTYSLEKPSQFEAEFAREFVKDYSKKVYKNLPFFKKLIFKIIKVL